MGKRSIKSIFIFLLISLSITKLCWPQIESIRIFLSQEFQLTKFSGAYEREDFFRRIGNISLNIDGYIYHPNFLKFKTRFYLFREKYKGISFYESLKSSRYSPYNVQINLFQNRPVSFSFSAFRGVSRNDTPYFYISRIEKRWSISHRLSFPKLPKIRVGYTSSVFSFEGANSLTKEVKLKQYFASLNYKVGKISTNLIGNYADYDNSLWYDSLRIQGNLKYLSREILSNAIFIFHKFGDLNTYSINFNRIKENHRFYLNGNFNLLPHYKWLKSSARYEYWGSKNFSFQIEPGFRFQGIPGFYYTEEFLQTSFARAFTKGKWNFTLIPQVRIMYMKGEGEEGFGAGIGLRNITRRKLGRGEVRIQLGFDYGKKLLKPSLNYRNFSGGIFWSQNWDKMRIDISSFHSVQITRFLNSSIRFYQSNSGLLITFPSLRTTLELRMIDLSWNNVAFKRRFGQLTIGDINAFLFRADIYGRFEYVNDTYYGIGGARLNKNIGEFQLYLITSIYSSFYNNRGRWWDIRFLIRRPINLL
ncbi:hypothetical protein NLC26_02510 [Candidatus Aminicenantes bacterium AC-708-M15]|jgi:hypothetical protein|nr:hypothetical protein [SCandidatus Aminicenantes bacterium Aminicenantia_JdfR_composite]MCP2598535.1 hypothetical protein [Candidatus Aminicenantes bacterium AC-335-L06]MCP2599111.1 hypothetical protein [Candidatus Aminicenantes bacterium AC-335-B20]MCP2604333.1 hypothetical protein [Candidatus Aminicenantes bacterium AC-708-M15]